MHLDWFQYGICLLQANAVKVYRYIEMIHHKNFNFKINSSFGWEFLATALWDKNIKFPSAQVCPLFFSFLYQPFYVTLCHFVSFYATLVSGRKTIVENSWFSTQLLIRQDICLRLISYLDIFLIWTYNSLIASCFEAL